mmetsp:Transcript_28355/g.90347  ORF Transcript_28355/g.90347 Transcript_28355/m.90347 type:complete len:308 (+) Transcript_28355:141-1064(+)
MACPGASCPSVGGAAAAAGAAACMLTVRTTARTVHPSLPPPAAPTARSTAPWPAAPCRNITSSRAAPSTLATVLSIPCSQDGWASAAPAPAPSAAPSPSPESTITPLPPRSATTCSARVGETWPKRLALGAATGRPAAAMSRRASGWAGTRTPTKPVPAVTLDGMQGAALAIRVRGPGQKAPASASNTSRSSPWMSTSSRARAVSSTCTIRGSVSGRPLASKMDNTAASSSALAPRPYTVSVGKATMPPERRMEAARSTPASVSSRTRPWPPRGPPSMAINSDAACAVREGGCAAALRGVSVNFAPT